MRGVLCVVLGVSMLVAPTARAQEMAYPGEALSLERVLTLAGERRAEIAAARARVRAAEARPEIAGALEDPVVSASLDHLPFMFDGADVSFTIEQRFPLSGIRGHRRAAAKADADRLRADMRRTQLDVQLDAGAAFLMLHERRRRLALLQTQVTSAHDVVAAAAARYSAAAAPQSDVLIAEIEVARLKAEELSLARDVRAAEAMLNTALAFPPSTPVPPLSAGEAPMFAFTGELSARPELEAARAAIRRADAEVEVMKDMFRPMATVRSGPAYTMAEGKGLMLMVGISIPLRRGALRAGVAEAEAMRSMAAADLEAMTTMFAGEAAAAHHALEAARARATAIREDVLPRARAAIGPSVSGYASGRLPLTTVITAVQSLWQIEADAIDAELQASLAALRLARATGSLEGAER